jgi:hypothetical protein
LKLNNKKINILVIIIFFLILITIIYPMAKNNYYIIRKFHNDIDNRALLAEWINKNISEGKQVLIINEVLFYNDTLKKGLLLSTVTLDDFFKDINKFIEKYDYIITSDEFNISENSDYSIQEITKYNNYFKNLKLLKKFDGEENIISKIKLTYYVLDAQNFWKSIPVLYPKICFYSLK